MNTELCSNCSYYLNNVYFVKNGAIFSAFKMYVVTI